MSNSIQPDHDEVTVLVPNSGRILTAIMVVIMLVTFGLGISSLQEKNKKRKYLISKGIMSLAISECSSRGDLQYLEVTFEQAVAKCNDNSFVPLKVLVTFPN